MRKGGVYERLTLVCRRTRDRNQYDCSMVTLEMVKNIPPVEQ